MSTTYHPEGCACGAHDDDNRGVTRRDLLKSLGALSAGMIAGPAVAMGALGERRTELTGHRAVVQGKAQ